MSKKNLLDKPIIFIGNPRSGTTIISEIIMRHKDLAFPSNWQNKFYKNSGINYFRLLFDNKLWRLYGQKKQINTVSVFNKYIFRPEESYPMWNYLTGPGVDFSRDFLLDISADEERRKFIRNYFSKMVKFQRRKRLTFKITGPSRINYLLSIFPDALFVILKRGEVPIISSLLKVDFWQKRGAHRLWWKGVYTKEEKNWAEKNKFNSKLLTAFQVKKVEDYTRLELQKYRPSYIEVYYEDFVKNPIEGIQKILRFLELEENASDCFKYLNKTKIRSSIKTDKEYFEDEDLQSIYKVLEGNNA
jgi:hypothetical protein